MCLPNKHEIFKNKIVNVPLRILILFISTYTSYYYYLHTHRTACWIPVISSSTVTCFPSHFIEFICFLHFLNVLKRFSTDIIPNSNKFLY